MDIRPMTAADVDFVLRQTAREGWDTARHRVEIHLAHDPGGAFIAEHGGEPVGMVTTTRYSTAGFIGNLIVAPDHRSRGLGRALMERGLAHLEAAGVVTVRLDGDPPGMALYRSLGFVDEWESRRYRATAPDRESSVGVRAMTEADLDQVCALDRPFFGEDRSRLVRLLAPRMELCLVAEDASGLTGFAFAEHTSRGVRVGPLVAVDVTAARSLLAACCAAVVGRTVTIGVPGRNAAGCGLLDELGFRSISPSLRMVRGPLEAVGDPRRVFAIAGGDIG
jgi:ribosomal protein S18 acetylase RimI-like enzyme